MARYAARYVSWFTQGGMTDECGTYHHSGLHYQWEYLSVLNEDEYHTPPDGGVIYTVCWDAWRREIAKVHPTMKLVGPETAGGPFGARGSARGSRSPAAQERAAMTASATVAATRAAPSAAEQLKGSLGGQLDFSMYFLNGSNHDDGKPPPVISNHVALYGPPWRAFFEGVDQWNTHVAQPLQDACKAMAPQTLLVMARTRPSPPSPHPPSPARSVPWLSSTVRAATPGSLGLDGPPPPVLFLSPVPTE
jgi:hypothetical protein